MEGIFKVYPIGKSMKLSKSGKYEYWFTSGLPKKEQGGLLDKCNCFNFWSETEYKFDFMQPVTATLDINGDFISVVEIME